MSTKLSLEPGFGKESQFWIFSSKYVKNNTSQWASDVLWTSNERLCEVRTSDGRLMPTGLEKGNQVGVLLMYITKNIGHNHLWFTAG